MAKFTLKQKLKAFSGLGFSLCEIVANNFDGYGFTFLSFSYYYVSLATISATWSLISFNAYVNYEKRKRTLEFRGSFLGMGGLIWSMVLSPRMDICEKCGDTLEDGKFLIEGVPYCRYCRPHTVELDDVNQWVMNDGEE